MPDPIELPVAEVETEYVTQPKKDANGKDTAEVETVAKLRLRLKGQRPDDKCLLEFTVPLDAVKTIHEAKKRNGTIWVKFTIKTHTGDMTKSPTLEESHLVVRDLLE